MRGIRRLVACGGLRIRCELRRSITRRYNKAIAKRRRRVEALGTTAGFTKIVRGFVISCAWWRAPHYKLCCACKTVARAVESLTDIRTACGIGWMHTKAILLHFDRKSAPGLLTFV
jgi:hypothetical protein